MRTSKMMATGTSKARPKAKNMPMTKFRYASISGAAVIDLGAKL